MNSGLPGGVSGIARLYHCQFAETDKGCVFIAEGEILEPREYAGLCTSLFIPTYATGVSAEHNLALILAELLKLGVNTDNIPLEQLAVVVAELRDRQVCFRFRTAKLGKTIYHRWDGIIKNQQQQKH